MFRVVPDQLRISEGWVRCGQCDEVFDANAHLHSLDATAAPTQTEPHHSSVPAPVPVPVPEFAPQPAPESLAYDWGPALSDPPPMEAVSIDNRAPSDPMPVPVQAPEAVPEASPLLEPRIADLNEESRFDEDWTATVYADPAQFEALPDPDARDRLDALVDDPPPSFMGVTVTPRTTSRWLGATALGALCGGLSVLLLVQIAIQERDRLAAASPALEPVLASACSVLSCTVSPLKEIESIAIDSSAFTSVRPGVYLLQLNLKNAAPRELATPALELTLTDGQERALLRRVVLPAELSGKRSIAAGMELSATLPISVKTSGTPEKIAGYKLLAFYP
jgi:predicted Zn finger-like uncharacterized protein